MVIKKFHAPTEAEAVLKAKEEMGSSAVVLNVKTVKHRGIAKLFKKDYVEITAALEEKIYVTGDIPQKTIDEAARKNEDMNHEDVQRTSAIEEKLNNLQSLLENKMKEDIDNLREEEKEEEDEKIKFLKLIYHQLIENEVDEKYANSIINDIENSLKKESNLDSILASVYQKIILKLGEASILENDGRKKVVFFIGPTGVGKTTTIAKLASDFKLNKGVKVGMITSDTYRIAAVEQLNTYASILDVPVNVIYTPSELNDAVKELSGYQMIFVDTAGRSHKNEEQRNEIIEMINGIKNSEIDVDVEIFLVLSVTTKYRDLVSICDAYKELKGYKLLFTKLDETTSLGNILNIRLYTEASLSYTTCGQNVPDDIETVDVQKLAKNILGGA